MSQSSQGDRDRASDAQTLKALLIEKQREEQELRRIQQQIAQQQQST